MNRLLPNYPHTLLLLLAGIFSTSLLMAQSAAITQTSFIGQPSFDVAAGGGYLYVQPTSPSIIPYDLANPEVPASQPTINYTGSANSFIEYTPGYLYGCGGVGNLFRVFDISSAANPTVIGSVPTGALNVRALYAAPNYGFAGSSDSIFIVNTTNKNSPTLAAAFSDGNLAGGTVAGLLANGSVLYVANTSSLLVYDISNPASPSFVTAVSGVTSSLSLSMDASNNRLFSGNSSGMEVYDISTPNAPSFVGSAGGSGANGILQYGGGFVLQGDTDNSSTQGVVAYLFNGGLPVFGGNFLGTIGFSITGMAAQDSIFYVCKFGGVEVIKLETIVGVEDGLELEAKWYPNPANERAFLQLPEGLAQADVQLYNQIGQVVRSWSQETVRQEVDLSQLAPGPYFIEINSEGYRPQRELIIVQ